MIRQADLVASLARRSLGGWSVVERIQDIAIIDEHRNLQRHDHRIRLTLVVHQDVPLGRGSARLEIDAYDGSADDLVDQAIALAAASIGPAWSATPPAAPANVTIADDQLIQRSIDAVPAGILARLPRPTGFAITAAASALREKVTIIASSGFHFTWPATALRADITIATRFDAARSTGAARPTDATRQTDVTRPIDAARSTDAAPPTGAARPTGSARADAARTNAARSDAARADVARRTLRITRHARRLDDLGLDTAIADAIANLTLLAEAGPPTPGPCDLWLGPDALLHGDDLGLWTIFAHQADSAVERLALGPYRWRGEIAPGAAQLPEPLTIISTGALDFATRSLPVTDDAVAIRNFPLIDRGIAVGLGLSPREAALRHMDPNGGVRNLDIPPGTWQPAPSRTTRTIEIRRLHAASIDFHTGEASLDIALAVDHRPNSSKPNNSASGGGSGSSSSASSSSAISTTVITGGTIQLNLISALGLARRSPQLIRRAAYHGPANVLIANVQLLV